MIDFKMLLSAISLLALGLVLKYFPAIDMYFLRALNSLMFHEVFLSYFTELGNGFICLSIVIPLLSFSSNKLSFLNFVKLEVLVISGVFIGCCVSVLKQITAFSVRPGFYQFDEINYLEPVFSYSSFPSGHSATIVGLVLIWLHHAIKNTSNYSSKILIVSLLLLAILVSLSRVAVGAHWISDIIGSFGIALLALEISKHDLFKKTLKNDIAKYLSYLLVVLSWTYIISQGSIY